MTLTLITLTVSFVLLQTNLVVSDSAPSSLAGLHLPFLNGLDSNANLGNALNDFLRQLNENADNVIENILKNTNLNDEDKENFRNLMQRTMQKFVQIVENGQAFNNGPKLQELIQNFLNDASKYADENVGKILQNYLYEAGEFSKNIGDEMNEFFQRVLDNFANSLQTYRSNIKAEMKTIPNRIKRQTLNNVVQQLERISDAVTDLQDTLEVLQSKGAEAIARKEQDLLQEWNIWATDVLDRVAKATNDNEEALTQTEVVLNNYFNTFSNLFISCTGDIDANFQEFFSEIQETIAKYQDFLDQLVDQVKICIDSDDSIRSISTCRLEIRKAQKSLITAPRDIEKLSNLTLKIFKSNVQDRLCIAQTVEEFEVGKSDLQQKIEKIIESVNGDSTQESDNSESGDIEAVVDANRSSG